MFARARTDIGCLVRGYRHQLHTNTHRVKRKCFRKIKNFWKAKWFVLANMDYCGRCVIFTFSCRKTYFSFPTWYFHKHDIYPNVFANINTMDRTFPPWPISSPSAKAIKWSRAHLQYRPFHFFSNKNEVFIQNIHVIKLHISYKKKMYHTENPLAITCLVGGGICWDGLSFVMHYCRHHYNSFL